MNKKLFTIGLLTLSTMLISCEGRSDGGNNGATHTTTGAATSPRGLSGAPDGDSTSNTTDNVHYRDSSKHNSPAK
jgi:hypothetical protein